MFFFLLFGSCSILSHRRDLHSFQIWRPDKKVRGDLPKFQFKGVSFSFYCTVYNVNRTEVFIGKCSPRVPVLETIISHTVLSWSFAVLAASSQHSGWPYTGFFKKKPEPISPSARRGNPSCCGIVLQSSEPCCSSCGWIYDRTNLQPFHYIGILDETFFFFFSHSLFSF